MDKITKEKKIRKEAVEAAQKLFQQYGFHKTTMEDIAKAMKRGKSTLYYYYKSKDEIFDAVLMTEMEDVHTITQNAVNDVYSAIEKLRAFFNISLKTAQSKGNLYQIVRGELGNTFSAFDSVLRKFTDKQVDILKEILIFGVNNNELNSAIADDIELFSYTIVSAFKSITLDLIFENKFPNWDERLDSFLDIMLNGLKK